MGLTTETLDACPVCRGRGLRPLLEVPDFESSTGTYGIVECGGCGLAFTNPRPIESELAALYAARSSADFPRQSRLVQRLRDWAIDRYLRAQLGPTRVSPERPLDVLDFGCGDGALSRGVLRHASARGGRARVTAVDFHSEAPAALSDADAGQMRYSSYAHWLEAGDRYDAVFLRHVLEHHPDPLRLLRELRGVLRPGARIFVEVPNRRSVWARIFGPCYFGYYVPRHLMHFDRSSLRSVVERSGLRCFALARGHTPLIGRSIAYRTGWNLGNLGLIGLATYPLQVVVDLLGRSSSTLRAIATSDG